AGRYGVTEHHLQVADWTGYGGAVHWAGGGVAIQVGCVRLRGTRARRGRWCVAPVGSGCDPVAVTATPHRGRVPAGGVLAAGRRVRDTARHVCCGRGRAARSEEHTSELQSRFDLVCRLLLEKKNVFYLKIRIKS